MNLGVIIPMYDKEEYTRRCIELVKQNHGLSDDVSLSILVVDDGSKKPFIEPSVDVLRLEENSGFTNATNQGILSAQYRNLDYVLLLNNDTEPEPDFISELLKVSESHPKIGISASVRLHPSRPNEPVELCGSDLIRGFQYFTELDRLPDTAIPCNWLPLCSALLRMDMIRDIGLLDNKYRNHCSDSSYCLVAKIRHWEVMMVPKSRVIHHLSVTTSANNVLVDADQRLFLEQLAGLDYQKIMNSMPLDGEAKTYGRLSFEVYKR